MTGEVAADVEEAPPKPLDTRWKVIVDVAQNVIQLGMLIVILLQLDNQNDTLKVVEVQTSIARSEHTMDMIQRGQTSEMVGHILHLNQLRAEGGGLRTALSLAGLINPAQPDYPQRLAEYNRTVTGVVVTLGYLQTLALCFEQQICSAEAKPIAVESFRATAAMMCEVIGLQIRGPSDEVLFEGAYRAVFDMFGDCPAAEGQTL